MEDRLRACGQPHPSFPGNAGWWTSCSHCGRHRACPRMTGDGASFCRAGGASCQTRGPAVFLSPLRSGRGRPADGLRSAPPGPREGRTISGMLASWRPGPALLDLHRRLRLSWGLTPEEGMAFVIPPLRDSIREKNAAGVSPSGLPGRGSGWPPPWTVFLASEDCRASARSPTTAPTWPRPRLRTDNKAWATSNRKNASWSPSRRCRLSAQGLSGLRGRLLLPARRAWTGGLHRAMIRNLQAGGIRKGGSTITQQIIKRCSCPRKKATSASSRRPSWPTAWRKYLPRTSS